MYSTKREPWSRRFRENAGEHKVHGKKVRMSAYEVQGSLRLRGELVKIP